LCHIEEDYESHHSLFLFFLFQVSFCFHIIAEHPKRDVALNDVTCLKDLSKNNNCLIVWLHIAVRTRKCDEPLTQNYSFSWTNFFGTVKYLMCKQMSTIHTLEFGKIKIYMKNNWTCIWSFNVHLFMWNWSTSNFWHSKEEKG
jgi:hypothetical protein